MGYCTHCGSPRAADVRFCTACGSPYSDLSSAERVAASPQPSVSTQEPAGGELPLAAPSGGAGRRVAIIGTAIAVLAGAGVAGAVAGITPFDRESASSKVTALSEENDGSVFRPTEPSQTAAPEGPNEEGELVPGPADGSSDVSEPIEGDNRTCPLTGEDVRGITSAPFEFDTSYVRVPTESGRNNDALPPEIRDLAPPEGTPLLPEYSCFFDNQEEIDLDTIFSFLLEVSPDYGAFEGARRLAEKYGQQGLESPAEDTQIAGLNSYVQIYLPDEAVDSTTVILTAEGSRQRTLKLTVRKGARVGDSVDSMRRYAISAMQLVAERLR